VTLTADEAVGRDQARVIVTTAAGERREAWVEHARGSLARPMNDSELREKFDTQAIPVIGPEAASGLAELITSQDGLDMQRLLHFVETHEAV
jgi:hypothetical protein